MVGVDSEPAKVVADPAKAVTVTGVAETVALDVAAVVTTLVAAPVALAGTVTVEPVCVETVFDDPLSVMTLPFGDVTIAPEGTTTDSFAVMVTEAPAATVVGPVAPELAAGVEPLPLPQATSIVLTHDTRMARNKIVMDPRSLINGGEEYIGTSQRNGRHRRVFVTENYQC